MARTQHRQSSGDYFLLGYEAIAAALGVSRQTIWRWVNDYGFPVASLPDGHVISSVGLIDLWLMERLKPGKPQREGTRDDTSNLSPNQAAAEHPQRTAPNFSAAAPGSAQAARRIAAVAAMLKDDPSLLDTLAK